MGGVMSQKKRYVATITMYVYGDNPEEAFNEAKDICQGINQDHDCRADVESMVQQPFGTLISKDVDLSPLESKRIQRELDEG